MNIISLDLELVPSTGEIIQVGLVDDELDTLSVYVDTEKPIDWERELTYQGDKLLSDLFPYKYVEKYEQRKVSKDVAVGKIKEFLSGTQNHLFVHWSGNDAALLRDFLGDPNAIKDGNIVDVKKLYRDLILPSLGMSRKKSGLGVVYERMEDTTLIDAHNAVYDADACLILYVKAVKYLRAGKAADEVL